MNGAILGMTRAEIDAKMDQIIEFSEVRDFIDTPVKRYSSGMYVKLAFSVAAHLDSEIMIMDEVLAVGDMAFQKKCLDKMRDAAKKEGRTVLYVSHNMNTIRQLCDRCVVLDKGKVIFQGDVEEAISVYMGNNSSNHPVFYDFTKNKRGLHFGQQVFLTHFRFLHYQTAEFQVGQRVEYEISLDSKVEMEALMCIIRIRDKSNGALVGGSLSQPFPVKIGPGQTVRFSMNLGGLVPDSYSFSLEIVERDQTGNYYSYDNPYAAMPVRITNPDAGGILWSTRYWGNVRLEDGKIIN
jgi:lipopolysaccharide transport system ATP-binding protein